MEKLEPLPIDFDEAAHKYSWRPTGEVMPYSVTTVCSWDMTADKRANIAATKDEWERRGVKTHAALESHLTGQPFEQDSLDEFGDWINPLLDHPFWSDFEVLASEYRMLDLKRGWLAAATQLAFTKARQSCLTSSHRRHWQALQQPIGSWAATSLFCTAMSATKTAPASYGSTNAARYGHDQARQRSVRRKTLHAACFNSATPGTCSSSPGQVSG